MMPSAKGDAFLTIIVVPRERFSYTRESLESIYNSTKVPFELVYVDGGSPPEIRRYLHAQSRERGFCLIRSNVYLSPNKARNLGLNQIRNTKYVVFIDNDVIVTPGWLTKLVECAEETDASIVGPLTCQGKPIHEIVHCAGGESGVSIENNGSEVKRHFIEKIYLQGRRVEAVREELKRQKTGLAEFHCMLVRFNIFQQIGSLDEQLLNSKEHVDFCISVDKAGGSIYFEPNSLVTYVFGDRLKLTDMLFYMIRWSDAWEFASLNHLRRKWNLTEDQYFKNRYKKVGWRRKMTILKPLTNFLTLNGQIPFLKRVVFGIEKKFNRFLTNHYT